MPEEVAGAGASPVPDKSEAKAVASGDKVNAASGEDNQGSGSDNEEQANRDKEAWRELAGEGDSWFDVIKRQEDARKKEEERCVFDRSGGQR